MIQFSGHFDGRVLTPDEQVEIPVNTPLQISIEPFFFQEEDGIRGVAVTGVQTCALPIYPAASVVLTPALDPKPEPSRRETPTPWARTTPRRRTARARPPRGTSCPRRPRAPARGRPRPRRSRAGGRASTRGSPRA